MTEPHEEILGPDALKPVCRCVCRRAQIWRYTIFDGMLMHVDDPGEEGHYCFAWSTYEFLRLLPVAVRWLLHWVQYLYFEHIKRPLRVRANPEEYKYDCAFCGRKTRQPAYVDEKGRTWSVYCSSRKCIAKAADESLLEEESKR